jgi:hypothetical protein
VWNEAAKIPTHRRLPPRTRARSRSPLLRLCPLPRQYPRNYHLVKQSRQIHIRSPSDLRISHTFLPPPRRARASIYGNWLTNKFRNEEPDLLGDYDKHVVDDAAVNTDLSSRASVETALNNLLEDRKTKQWKVSVFGHDVKIRAQIGRLVKILQWSDPLVKDAMSTQPYAALAWSGVSLLLPVRS